LLYNKAYPAVIAANTRSCPSWVVVMPASRLSPTSGLTRTARASSRPPSASAPPL